MPLYCRCAGDFELTFPAKVPTPKYIIQLSEESDIQHSSHVLFSPLLSTELLRADRGVSEHRVSLQHELPGGDHRLVGCYEPTHQPERSLNVTSAPPALPPLHLRRPLLNLRKTV